MRNFNTGDVECYEYFIIPKALVFNEEFRNLSSAAKLLYAFFVDRLNLSIKNNWVDKNNDVYLISSIDEINKTFCISNSTSVKIIKELEEKKLIKKKKQGLNKPNLIYLQKITFKVEKNKQYYEGEKNEKF